MNLNRNQMLAIAVAILGVMVGSTAQLTDLFGPSVAKTVISAAGLTNSTLAAVLAVLTGQSGMVKDVLAMPGVEKIDVNRQANSTLAALAVDPAVDKIAPVPGDVAKVTQIANGGSS